MTCIVGIVHNDRVYIGGDSAGTAGWSMTVRADQKVFINSGFIFGFCGSFRMGQLLRYAFTPPAMREDTDLFAYMVTDFIDAVRECFKQGGFAEKDKEAESGGFFLVGTQGRLFQIECDYQVGERLSPWTATGCGEDIALGALYATQGRSPTKRIHMALDAACEYSAGVRGPYTVLSV